LTDDILAQCENLNVLLDKKLKLDGDGCMFHPKIVPKFSDASTQTDKFPDHDRFCQTNFEINANSTNKRNSDLEKMLVRSSQENELLKEYLLMIKKLYTDLFVDCKSESNENV